MVTTDGGLCTRQGSPLLSTGHITLRPIPLKQQGHRHDYHCLAHVRFRCSIRTQSISIICPGPEKAASLTPFTPPKSPPTAIFKIRKNLWLKGHTVELSASFWKT